MARFNYVENNNATLNNEGARAFKMDNRAKLVTQVLTTFFSTKPKFYGNKNDELIVTAREVMKTDPLFVANLAIFARKEFNMRTVAHVLVAELAQQIKGAPYVKEAIEQVCNRPDDMAEVLAYTFEAHGKPVPNSMKKGIAAAMRQFDEYQLGKYNREGAVTLKDILNLTHPVGNPEQHALWGKVLNDSLQTPFTWETELSAKGNNKATWEGLLDSNKVGYMALMRNLRNIVNANVDPMYIDALCAKLSYPGNVKYNKQLPFRYYSAYKEVCGLGATGRKLGDALEQALMASLNNMIMLRGKTAICSDISGSMTSTTISEKSTTTCADIASLLLAVGARMCYDSVLYVFNNSARLLFDLNKEPLLATRQISGMYGGGTNLGAPIQELLRNRTFVDRIIILSDNEINRGYRFPQSLIDEYRRTINPEVWVHAIDLQGYGTQQFKGKNVNIIAGWSEKVFDFIQIAEDGIGSLTDKIAKYAKLSV